MPQQAPITTTTLDHAGRGRRRPTRTLGYGLRLTERDRQLLAFISAHRFVLACHVQAWLGVGRSVCYRRLASLVDARLLSYQRFFDGRPGCYLVTGDGLALAGMALPVPRIDLRSYTHDAGLVWLWLSAVEGRFGAFERLLAEREMRSHDQRDLADGERYGIRLLGVDRHERPRTHYPDLLLIGDDRRRVALEVELTLKSRRRLRAILAGYGAQPGLQAVRYFASGPVVANAVLESVASLGLEELVSVRAAVSASRPGDWSSGWQVSFAAPEAES